MFSPYQQATLAQSYMKMSSQLTHHLLMEAHLFLRTRQFLHGSDDITTSLLSDSSAMLGDQYLRLVFVTNILQLWMKNALCTCFFTPSV